MTTASQAVSVAQLASARVKICGLSPVTKLGAPPSAAVISTVYPVSATPLAGGAVQTTVADSFPAVALTKVGGSGIEGIKTAFDRSDCGPTPAMFKAATLKVYVSPAVRPVNSKFVFTEPVRRTIPPVTPSSTPVQPTAL